MNDERWLPIPGYELNQVSTEGRIRSRYGRIRVVAPNSNGYPKVGLRNSEGTIFNELVHVLVARAFLGECPPGFEVDHLNADRSDARLVNLEYVSRQENLDRAIARRAAVHPGCSNCGGQSKPFRQGRCNPCAEYFRRTGKERNPKIMLQKMPQDEGK